jgi:mannose-6-phosphate isomerase-like protein (cupin superfamily)
VAEPFSLLPRSKPLPRVGGAGSIAAAERTSRPDSAERSGVSAAGEQRKLQDPYMEWARAQAIPIVEDFGIDIRKVPVKAWDRYGMKAAFCHLKGRDDFISIFAFELPPGGKSRPLHHLYEEVIYVISGHGSTMVTTPDGRQHSFEWGAKSLFSIPLNATYQHFNGSGREPARFASTNNMVFTMNRFRSEALIYGCDAQFPERMGGQNYFAGEGEFIAIRPGRHQWETNFVADLSAFELKHWAERGAGGSMLRFVLADNTIGAHSSEMPVGTYKKGHRHFDGVCVYACTGQGYSLLWHEDDKDFTRVDWEHGVVYCPPDSMFHQHFNVANHPSRYLALQIGTVRYPLLRMKREIWDVGVDKDIKEGGAQVEYEDQDPRIHQIWLDEIAKNGVTSGMGKFVDESRFARQSA